ncbi:MAG: transposase [Sinobacteraceae bacterium]|nr:transposase [Nevskiaceae bacterium]
MEVGQFAIQKGHRYATVIVEPTRKRVLWIGRGRGREDVRPCFELMGRERCAGLNAAVTDMNAGYELKVRHHCPQAAQSCAGPLSSSTLTHSRA